MLSPVYSVALISMAGGSTTGVVLMMRSSSLLPLAACGVALRERYAASGKRGSSDDARAKAQVGQCRAGQPGAERLQQPAFVVVAQLLQQDRVAHFHLENATPH